MTIDELLALHRQQLEASRDAFLLRLMENYPMADLAEAEAADNAFIDALCRANRATLIAEVGENANFTFIPDISERH